ncbi:hypothetical protein [Aurantiacibacter sediminis]|uniref:Uncharacterized protein n=2 Tax=Aurantiacibacter sediminis TaxID=2793064 RepID=A0ABS0N354_9SPHN|nr:hypothetical protein [Aurantiacibacter sediminis]MBH5322382.1 hypothetical protein [Aurantiacibacter sediminis]
MVRLDEIENALDIEQETELEDISEADSLEEDRAALLANEVGRRTNVLADAYPFSISENGEKLSFLPELNFGRLSYLICLILNNSWTSGRLQAPLRLTNEELRSARDIFEVVSLFAALGRTGGPGFLLGTNRAGAEALLRRLRDVCEKVGEGRARDAVPAAAPPAANDDGVDIISVELEPDGPPMRVFSFGQSASGQNFKDKPIKNLVEGFLDIWFDTQPQNTEAAMYIPAILDQNDLRYYNGRLGLMIHRPRLAAYAQRGFELYLQNQELVHYVDDVDAPQAFYNAYLRRIETDVA